MPRISVEHDDPDALTVERMSQLVQEPNADQITGLVIGPWGGEMFEEPPTQLLEVLLQVAPRLVSLEGIFFGDVTSEECEVSWIQQADLSPLLTAFPKLRHLRIRGSGGLSLGSASHGVLDTLIIESGGLPPTVVHEVLGGQLPSLRHLELYLGSPHYEGDSTIDDLRVLLSGDVFPNLEYLGLKNSEFSDTIAQAMCESPLLDRLKVLDLSLGTLGDDGANALLACEKMKNLDSLILKHHYMSDVVAAKISELLTNVDVSEGQGACAEEDRYCEVSE